MDNPDITVSDIVTDVENRLDSPSISTSTYLPWVSYAYQKLYQALIGAGGRVKEELFGNYVTFDLAAETAEYDLETYIPRYGGTIKVEIKYGGTGDDWIRAKRLPSLANYKIQNNSTTNYRAKSDALYYIIQGKIGFIPTPPSTDSGTPSVRIWYIKRPYQLTASTDVIDIPYRFIYPLVDYVQAKAIMSENEDYTQADKIEANFRQQLIEVADAANSEFDENDGTNFIQVSANSSLYSNPLRR